MRNLVSYIAIGVLITACAPIKLYKPHRVNTRSEAAAMNVAVTFVAPWEEYAGQLAPEFDLTAKQALTEVLPTTSIVEEKVIDALAGFTRLGLPTSKKTVTETTTLAEDGTVTATSEEKKEKGPGTVPGEPSVIGADQKASSLGGVPDELRNKGLSSDPILKYQAATALYQEVKLLNRYIQDAALKYDMKAYVVRVQINVLPYARHQPYDLYATLGFFGDSTSDEEDFCKTNNCDVNVLPLLVTDNLEGALKSRTVDTLRQFALALSVLSSGVAGEVALSKKLEELNSVLGNDTNSLLTVGRVSNNTVVVRLGASLQATASFGMLPRTHNITFLLMVPNSFASNLNDGRHIRLAASWQLRDALLGTELAKQNEATLYDEVDRMLSARINQGYKKQVEICKDKERNLQECDGKEEKKSVERTAQQLVYTIYGNAFKDFSLILKSAGRERHHGTRRLFWLEISELMQKIGVAGAQFELPRVFCPELPNEQAILVMDDTKKNMTVRLLGGKSLVPDQLQAHLELHLKDGTKVPLPASSVSVAAGGGSPTFVFPSAKAWHIGPLARNGFQLVGSKLHVSLMNDTKWNTYTAATKDQIYTIIQYRESKEEPDLFKLRAPVKNVTAKYGVGSVKFAVEFVKDAAKKQVAEKVQLEIEGGNIVSAKSSAEKEIATSLGKIVVEKDSDIDLELKNLDAKQKITVKGQAIGKDNKPLGGAVDPLSFNVK